ncbi:MAG: FKBP-type peptidyl-prolyl cis-trans isomerase [Chromatiales bacterium]|jgi:FKBP-type peptidyl-prolyl cis-trans isomerase SlpA
MYQSPPKITTHSEIKLHYSITLEDGTDVVSTFAEDPFTCRIGDGTLAERLELCLIGMSEGDSATFMLSGDEVFGPTIADNIQCVDIEEFPPEMSLTIGQLIAFTTPGGDEVVGTIQSLSGQEVTVDFNHPLSGRSIEFKVTILKVDNTSSEQHR